MSALIGALRVSLSADSANFEAGMKRAQRQAATSATGISKSMGLIKSGVVGFVSGLSVGMLTTAIKNALDYAASLGEVSQQIGVTTKDLQTIRYAASQVGVSQEEVDKGLSKLTITLGQVAAGAKAPTKALQAIGLTAKDLAGVDTGAAFRKIADGLAKVEDRSQRAAVEVALFGRTGSKLDTMLSGGSGALNELSDAAERLGIVLSDEQIQKADETADKLDALQTVLKAKIAGAVADNSDAILGLADAVSQLVSEVTRALPQIRAFYNQVSGFIAGAQADTAQFISDVVNNPINRFNPLTAPFRNPAMEHNRQNTIKAGRAKQKQAESAQLQANLDAIYGRSGGLAFKPKAAQRVTPRPISQFLGSGGGSKTPRAKADHGAEDAKRQREQEQRESYRFDQDMRRSQMDILQARKDLSVSADERAAIDLQLLDIDRAGYKAQLDFDVATTDGNKKTAQARADQLLAEYDKADALKRQAIAEDLAAQKQQDMADLVQTNFDIRRDLLEKEANLATTASERRNVELRILDLAYQQEKARLEAVLADKKSSELAKQEAQARLNALGQGYGQDRQGVMNSTRGPLEGFAATLPSTAEQWNEALENVAVNGIQSVTDGLMGIIDGTKSAGDAFRDMAQGIIQDLLRIMIQKAIMQAIGAATGAPTMGLSQGGPVAAFAVGGFVSGPGTPTSDSIPAMLSNGEFVMNARAVNNLGVPILDGMNSGKITARDFAGAGAMLGFNKSMGPFGGGLIGALMPKKIKSPFSFGLLGSILGFSDGGLVGDAPIFSGLPIPRVSHAERLSVGNDNQRMNPVPVHIHLTGPMSDSQARKTGMQAAAGFQSEIARSRSKGISR